MAAGLLHGLPGGGPVIRTLGIRAALSLLAAGIVVVAVGDGQGGDLRAPGLELLERAEAHDLAQPGLPLPILVVGRVVQNADAKVAAGARAGGWLVAAAVACTVWAAGALGGPLAAAGAGALMLLLPGTLYHARTLGPEAAAMAAYALLLLASVQARAAARGLLGSAALLCALASAHEAIVMVIPWLLAAQWLGKKTAEETADPGTTPLTTAPAATFLPVVLAPVLLMMVWPHLSAGGLKAWFAVVYEPFKLPHPPFLVLGEVHDQLVSRGPTVLHGWLVTALRIPVVTALMAGVGAAAVISGVRAAEEERRGIFALLSWLTLAAIWALNGSPYYAGTDAFVSGAPMLALLGGLGVVRVIRATQRLWPAERWRVPSAVAAGGVAILIVATAAVDLHRAWPMEPSYHNALIGGTSGAARRGMETSPNHYVPAAVVDWMNSSLPTKARVAFLPASPSYRTLLGRLRTVGLLRRDIEPAAPYHATHVVVPRHPAFPLYPDLLATFTDPLITWDYGGVRHMAVYAY